MLNVTKLLCGTPTEGDGLRYGVEVAGRPRAPRPQARVHHRPVIVWTATRRCNLHCLHCYADSQDRQYSGELTTAQAGDLIRDLAGYGVPVLLFSGGEPLMRPDLLDLIRDAVSQGLRAVLSTNGTLLDRATVKALASAGISYVGVSLDGPEALHDRLRGARGAFGDALRGIRLGQDQGIKVGVRFTLTRRNAAALGQLFELVEREDIRRVCIYHLVYSGRGARVANIDLPAAERRPAVEQVFEATLRADGRGTSTEVLTVDNHADAAFLLLWMSRRFPDRVDQAQELLRRNGGNSSGVGIGCVDNVGCVHPDQFWQHHSLGNVTQRPFGDIWEDTRDPLMAGLKDRTGLLNDRCRRCRFLGICNGNMRVRAEAAHGDVWGEDPACYLTDQEISATADVSGRSRSHGGRPWPAT